MKPFLLLLIGLFTAFTLKAQDNIYFRNGKVTEVRIKKVTANLIYYTAPEGGPQRYMHKDAVEKIVYKSGREVIIPDPNAKTTRRGRPAIYNNTLTIAPLHLLFMGNMTGIGVGADYEHYFGERHLISLHIPVYLGICTDNTLEKQDNDEPYTEGIPFYTSPGVRFHPIKPGKRLDYAVGVSVLIGNVNQTTYYEDSRVGGPNTDAQVMLSGVTLDNDLNLSRKKFLFGLHTAFGPLLGDYGKGGNWFVQVGFKLGRAF